MVIKSKIEINTSRLKIRLLNLGDINSYVNALKQPFYSRYMDNKASISMSKAEMAFRLSSFVLTYSMPYFEFEYNLMFVVRLKETGEFIGGVTVYPPINGWCAIGYWVYPRYQNNGYAKEAIKGVLDYFSTVIGIKDFELRIQHDNIASIQVAEKLGFNCVDTYIGAYKENKRYRLSVGGVNEEKCQWQSN